MARKRVIAAFDFDETLISKDSLLDFLRHAFSPAVFMYNVMRTSPSLVLFKLGKINNQQAKERLLTNFLRGMSDTEFLARCAAYGARLDAITNPAALARLQWHQTQGHEVLIISASIEDWIRPWAQAHHVAHIISTKLERTDGTLTGKLATPNCHSAEKAVRFTAEYPNRASYELYMYGDGKSDRQMFELADHVFESRFE